VSVADGVSLIAWGMLAAAGIVCGAIAAMVAASLIARGLGALIRAVRSDSDELL
jgi:hypothetical protein